MSDISSIFIWWLTIFIIGIIFLPLTFTIFQRFADRGYIFSKVVGILLSSYVIWLLGSLKILPFAQISIIITLVGFAIFNMWLLRRTGKNVSFSKRLLFLIIFEESIFFIALFFWSYVRATEPSIRGLEKFMDFGFVNSILRSNYFPPADMWLAKSPDYSGGYFINYYYFGHYVTAFLTKLSSIDSAVTYNLSLALLFAFTFTLSFSIGMNLYYLFSCISNIKDQISKIYIKNKKESDKDTSMVEESEISRWQDPRRLYIKALLAGLLAAFLVTLGGNLHTIYTLTSGYPVESPQPPWKLSLGFYPERYWYPNATRFIPFTIHEFPIYSFVVADLHGHVSDIPFVLLTIAVLLSLITRDSTIKKEGQKENGSLNNFLLEFENHTNIPFLAVLLLGMLLSVMYMTNAWDGLIYMILTGMVFLYINLKNSGSYLKDAQGLTLSVSLLALYKTFSASLFLLFFFLIVNLPFSMNFRPFVSGIGVLCAPNFLLGKNFGPFLFETGKCQKSPIWMLAILWGFFYYNVIGFLIFAVFPSLRKKWEMGNGKLDNEVRGGNKKISHFPFRHLTSHISHLTSNLSSISPIDIFVLLLIFISTLLLIFPEYFYMKDIYPAHYRANTVFKLGYQAFMMLGLSSGYIIFRLKDIPVALKRSLSFLFYNFLYILLFTLVGIYPYFAINSYYGGLRIYRGLFGLNWLAAQYPDDYKAIIWMRDNIGCKDGNLSYCNNQPVIVEANGDSYTDYARVSANTGLPTIVGWPVHEWLWRGSYDEAGKRIPEVAAIYESKDMNQTREVLRKYSVQYIFVGTLERDKYKNLDEEKLKQLGKVVFESGNTRVYKVNSIPN